MSKGTLLLVIEEEMRGKKRKMLKIGITKAFVQFFPNKALRRNLNEKGEFYIQTKGI